MRIELKDDCKRLTVDDAEFLYVYKIDISQNNLEIFDINLLDVVRFLNISHNNLRIFKTILPKNLTELYLYNNKLIKFDVILPPNLENLNLHYNRLRSFNSIIPNSLRSLDLYDNDNLKKLKLNRIPNSYFAIDFTIKNKKTFYKKAFYLKRKN